MSRLSWSPVRRGKRYCSSSCGGGCTYAAYVSATKKAKELARRLGNKWDPHVWENLGWHYSAKRLTATVYPGAMYWASVYLGGNQFQGESKSPRVAFEMAVAKGRDAVRKMGADLANFET